MNHKLLRMIEKAGFEFTPDVMAKLPEFEKLVGLEREACAALCDKIADDDGFEGGYAAYCADMIRARGKHD